MVPDRQKVWTDGRTDGRNGRRDGRRQNYIPSTSSGDNKTSNPAGYASMGVHFRHLHFAVKPEFFY